MKVFISQPMRGKTDEEILAEREQVIKEIMAAHPDAEVIDSFLDKDIPEKHIGVKCLARSIEMLDDADEVWFMDGWQDARGCRIEHDIAEAYNIPIHHD